MNPHDSPEVFSVLVLGTATSPGKVTITGHDRKPDWDIQKAKGSSGASTKLSDPKPPGGFKATFELATAEEVEAWDAFQAVVESTFMGPTPVALPCYHPDLARNGYTEVVGASIGGLTCDRKGLSKVVVDFQEYCPPKPKPTRSAGGRAAGASGSAGGNNGSSYDPNAAKRREFAELWDEVNEP